ncbi:hypothetical protein D3876_18375 [Sphingomonas cavernae]|uniref:DUF6538 domain-containing protein n=1 Tax=Sphingomonas cavernae TaxID=2320861 RepID=A0A418W793_9SPHN|nr:hypothetical protein D3876_18375 [Sphingomonas cavernae]
MCRYLHGPRDNGMYYFRRPTPEALRPIIDKREFFFSLRTKDKDAAKRLLPYHEIETQRELDAVQAELAVREVAALPVATPSPAQLDAERAQADWEEENAAFWVQFTQEQEAQKARQAARQPHKEAWERRARGSTAEMRPGDAAIVDLLREARRDSHPGMLPPSGRWDNALPITAQTLRR